MKTNLLLVEDDDAVHGALAEVLQGEGYDVVHAFGTADAILATQLNEEIGLVLLDLNLGGENGWDVFERLTRTNPLLPIIIITARSDQRALAEAAGVGALMEKPLNIPRLLELIAQLIAERPAARIARLTGHAPHALYSESRESRSEPSAQRVKRGEPHSVHVWDIHKKYILPMADGTKPPLEKSGNQIPPKTRKVRPPAR